MFLPVQPTAILDILQYIVLQDTPGPADYPVASQLDPQWAAEENLTFPFTCSNIFNGPTALTEGSPSRARRILRVCSLRYILV